MASIVIEHFERPATARGMRALGDAGARAGEVLGGRTVWCAAALPGAGRPAHEFRARMDGAGPGVSAVPLPVAGEEALRRLAEHLDLMLAGVAPDLPGLGSAEARLYAEAARAGDALVGADVGRDDVVVVHDPLSAIVARVVRERGAHAVWRLRIARRPAAAARHALEFMQRSAPGVDAYVLGWRERDGHGRAVERIAAVMPAAGLVATKEYPTGFRDEGEPLAWRTALAEVVHRGRRESVGGTRRPRPAVTAR